MNDNTTVTPNIPQNQQGHQSIITFTYGAGLALGFFFFMFIILSISSYITKCRARHLATTAATSTDSGATKKIGLNEAILLDIPKLLYSQAKLHQHRDSAACSICLADYKETDVLRMLPDCSHQFHLKCVDPWLRLNLTCPICRKSPMGTSLATPGAEATTLRF